ncbi:MAG: hypothetical protein JW900_00025 [Anaerolineae bacterium]|nr:hypothetical protein [Anaerolineae bacterium]
MSKKNEEIERLMRIRDRQLQTRDPQIQNRKIRATASARRRTVEQRISGGDILKGSLTDIPNTWKGVLIGSALGVALLIVLAVVVQEAWVGLAGMAGIIVLAIVGYLFGAAFEWRDKLRDELKKL